MEYKINIDKEGFTCKKNSSEIENLAVLLSLSCTVFLCEIYIRVKPPYIHNVTQGQTLWNSKNWTGNAEKISGEYITKCSKNANTLGEVVENPKALLACIF